MSINIFVLFLFFNVWYYKDFDKIIKKHKEISKIQDKYVDINKLEGNSLFIENKQLERIIKKSIFSNNLNRKNFIELKETFKKFLPKELYDEIGYKGYERISLGNFKIKNIVIMFIDIAGFTAISEKTSPEKILFLLNIYFDGIGEIILKNNGYIDKFLGDGIMVIFDDFSVNKSVNASIEIQKFINKLKIGELGKKIDVGIGINYGEVIAGTVGTKTRMEATYIGDTINTASRLESLTRYHDKNIIISKELYEKIDNKDKYKINYLGKELLKGKKIETDIYEVKSI